MSDQDGTQVKAVQRPSNDDREAWRRYWNQRMQEWRFEPEIDEERQKYLGKRRNSEPDTERGIYPFGSIKLGRADVEWLLATHDNRRESMSQGRRERLDLQGADLRGVNLKFLPLEGAILSSAHLENAVLISAHLEDSDLVNAHLEGANLMNAKLQGSNLSNAFFDSATSLYYVTLSDKKWGSAQFTDVHWGDVNLAVVDWSKVSESGDESMAREIEESPLRRPLYTIQRYYIAAARAYRQLSVVLRNQGLIEDANRFAYRAQLMQRKVYRHDVKPLEYLGSLFLDLLAGYGYKAWRSFLAYLIVITAFATAYFIIGRAAGPALSPLGAWVFSMTSFHGRGFFPGGIKLDDPLTVLAAIEAFIGLLIEVTFIATLTRRLFGQ